jgi:hypothetical protein
MTPGQFQAISGELAGICIVLFAIAITLARKD